MTYGESSAQVLMKAIFTVFILLIGIDSLAQHQLNSQGRRLTKTEFSELKKQKEKFIPSDIKADTLVILRYTATRLAQLQRTARNEEFARNGEDTTGYTDEKLFGKKQTDRSIQRLEKFSKEYPEQQAKALKERGVHTVVVDETVAQSNKHYRDKYWLTTLYMCNQDGFHASWYSTAVNRIYDPRTGKNYDLLRVFNYEIIDLVE